MIATASVVIPTYGGRERLRESVPPLLADPDLHELVVVVDGSPDGSFEMLEEWARGEPRLRPVYVDNGGDNRARQIGLERATGDVVVFLDDDVVGEPGLVGGHLAHHRRSEGLVVIGYMPVAGAARPGRDDYPVRMYAKSYEAQCEDYERRPERILENLWAGNTSVRREDCLAVGIPNPVYDTRYAPDRELGLRFQEAGLRGVFDRSLRAAHHYTRTPEAFLADAASFGEGMWLCHRLHPGILGELTPEHFERGLSAKTRWVVRLARRPGFATLAEHALGHAVELAGLARRWSAQEQLAFVLARVSRQRAAVERSRRPVGPPR